MTALKEDFKPEFLNRIDEIIIFNYLGKESIEKIVDLELEKVSQRLNNKKIELQFTPKLKEVLAEKGFDPNMGARPLKRVIQKEVLDPIALKIVSGEIEGGGRVMIDFEDGKIIFRTAKTSIKTSFSREKAVV